MNVAKNRSADIIRPTTKQLISYIKNGRATMICILQTVVRL